MDDDLALLRETMQRLKDEANVLREEARCNIAVLKAQRTALLHERKWVISETERLKAQRRRLLRIVSSGPSPRA